MKSPLRTLPWGNSEDLAAEKQRLRDQIRTRGTGVIPDAPRDVQIQAAHGGVFVTWKLPVDHVPILGWRLYLNTESNLAVQIKDKGTRQVFVPVSSGPSPSKVNIMVSAITALGRESTKVVKSAAPTATSDTTTVPTVPPGYLKESAGGKDRSLVSFRGQKQYIQS